MTAPGGPWMAHGQDGTATSPLADVRAAERRDRERLAELEREREEMFLVVAALVVKYGEDSAQADRLVRLTDAELADARRDSLTMYREDDPRGFVLRVRP